MGHVSPKALMEGVPSPSSPGLVPTIWSFRSLTRDSTSVLKETPSRGGPPRVVALTLAPLPSPPTRDPAGYACISHRYCSLQGPSFIVAGKIKVKTQECPQTCFTALAPVSAGLRSPVFPTGPSAGGGTPPFRPASLHPTPAPSGIRLCLAQRQDMTYRWKGIGGHLRTGPRRIGCRTSDTRSPGPRLPAPAKISGCGRSLGCGRVPAASPPEAEQARVRGRAAAGVSGR